MTARELALRILEQRFGPAARARPPSPELAAFQQEAHERLVAAIGCYGGALLADSVGLGKTFVAAAVARTLEQPGSTTIAVVPTSLLRLWRTALRGLARVMLLTHATLSRSGGPPGAGTGLVIVDEAHAFRNPRTRRYAALARLVEQRSVLLLTATPVNNSVWDLYWLLRLFAAEDAFAELGVPHLGACFDQVQRSGRMGRLPAVLAAVAVRRSRTTITELHGEVRVGGRALAFPRRAPPCPVHYDLPASLRELLSGPIEELELRPWQDCGPASGLWLLRLLLLKRLESSGAALRASLARVCGTLQAFLDALARGLRLVPAPKGSDPAQLELAPLLLRALPARFDIAAAQASARRDLARLHECLARLDPAATEDPKLAALQSLLDGELRHRPVLLFTEFRESAEYLWRSLRDRIPCALIHGSGAWLGYSPCSRRAVIERFAPAANGVPPPPDRERVRLLIATDVLAEGLNLQDAADVVSYDLPWNPVRLVQRLGRIDRLGSPHDWVRSWYFVPQRELENLLGLVRRIRLKLRAIRTTMGPEAPVLALPAPAAALRRLAAGDAAPFHDAERLREGMFDIDERLRAAFRRAVHPAADALCGLPLAAGSERRRSARQVALVRDPKRASRIDVAGLTPPVGMFAGRQAREPPAALVCLQIGLSHRAVFVRGRSCYEDDVTAGEILLHALGPAHDTPAAPPDTAMPFAARVAHRALRWIQFPSPPLRTRNTARRLRLRLLRLLQELPGGGSDAECRRAEHLIDLLGRAPPAAEVALQPLLRHSAEPLDSVLQQLEDRLRVTSQRSARLRPPAARQTPQVTLVVGVFLLDLQAG